MSVFDNSKKGRKGVKLPKLDVDTKIKFSNKLLRDNQAKLPELSELDVVRHFTRLSSKNFSIDLK